MSITRETIALRNAVELMRKLVMVYRLYGQAIHPDTKLKYAIEARVCTRSLEQHARDINDPGLQWAANEAKLVLHQMLEGTPHENNQIVY